MMHLALTDSEISLKSRFRAPIFPEVFRHSELRQDTLRSMTGTTCFLYVGTSVKQSSETCSDVIAEALRYQSKHHRIDSPSLSHFSTYAVLEVEAPSRESPKWVKHLNTTISRDVGDIANTISSVLREVRKNGLMGVDRALTQVDFQKADSLHLVGMLRALKEFKNDLRNWTITVEQVRIKLSNAGLKVDKLMRGLDGQA